MLSNILGRMTMKKLLLIAGVILMPQTGIALQQHAEQYKKIHFGQQIFRKKLQKKCGYTAGHWAQQHTRNEWKKLMSKDTFLKEFTKMCPRGSNIVKENWIEPLYLFAIEYAKDSGKKPHC